MVLQATRIIGIVHRRKKTKEEEVRPTKVAIQKEGMKLITYDLAIETDELDFLLGRFPISYRKAEPQEDLKPFQLHHLKWRKLDETEKIEDFADSHVRVVKKKLYEVVDKVPAQYDGLKSGDAVAMPLGGSGDRFAAALSCRGEEVGAQVYRIPGNILLQLRGEADKDDNYLVLAQELAAKLASGVKDMRPFYELRGRDRPLIRLKQVFMLRQQAMQDRIACEQRIEQAAIGAVFLSEEGKYPEGEIEDIYAAQKASDKILAGLQAEEYRRMTELKLAVHATPIWPLFEAIKGCGEATAGRLIAAIGDIRRFWVDPDPVKMKEQYRQSRRLERKGKLVDDLDKVADRINPGTTHFQILQMVASWKHAHGKGHEAVFLQQAIACHQRRSQLRHEADLKGARKLRAFCGVHVRQGGKYADVSPEKSFPRRRSGEVSNWHPWARQALYLLGDQFNRRPAAPWGQKLLHYKALYKASHPEMVRNEAGKQRYNDGHIHKTGIWKTLSHFVDLIFREWTRAEKKALQWGPTGDPESSLASDQLPDIDELEGDEFDDLEDVAA